MNKFFKKIKNLEAANKITLSTIIFIALVGLAVINLTKIETIKEEIKLSSVLLEDKTAPFKSEEDTVFYKTNMSGKLKIVGTYINHPIILQFKKDAKKVSLIKETKYKVFIGKKVSEKEAIYRLIIPTN